jgi:hypothetical protein
MSHDFSLASVLNKNRVDSDVPLLMALKIDVVNPATTQVVETLRVVANNEDITLLGETYVASAFDVSLEESSEELPSISINVVDITQTIQRYMQDYKGGNGTHVTMYIFFAPSTTVTHVESEYKFDVKSASSNADKYTVSWEVGAENPLTLPIPARYQMKERCQWRYKSAECGYAGAMASCDLSLEGANGCRAHDNHTRFGGLPGIQVSNV